MESRSGGESEGEGDLEDVVSPQQEDVSPQQEDAPPHPARRPMNAFLIFCKRHRAQVREKYPHLENRQVTKILGEWWADLPAQQKTSYTELARQYKEAFLRANPDFKWYKIPAQPPRPPPARPSNQKVPRCDPLPTDGAITFGKLADEAQMGGLSTLLSTASTSSSSNQNIASGPSSLTTFTTAYVSAANTSTARCAPIDSFPSVAALSTLSDVNSATSGSSNATANSTCGSSISTNTSVTTSLSTWSGTVQPSAVAPSVSPDSNNPAISNGPKPSTGSDPAVVTTSQSSVQSSLSETATNMTPPKPPKKRYVHANMLDQPVPVVSTQAQITPSPEKAKISSTEENAKSSASWTFSQGRQKPEGGAPPATEASEDQQRRVSNGPFSSRSVAGPPPGSPPRDAKASPQEANTPSEGTKPPPIGCSTPANVQPLNLTRETKLCTSNQEIIDSVVDRKCSEPNFPSSVPSETRPGYPRFFRPENLHNNNNNNNDIEKPSFPQAILNKVNGTYIKFCMSQAIHYVVDKAYDKGSKAKVTPKGDSGEKNQSAETNEKKEVEGENQVNTAKESVDSNNSNNSNPSDNANPTQRKRSKEKGPEENETSPKKRRDVPSGRASRETSRGMGGDTSGGRSRAPRKLKGKRYEELISEGVLQAPRRSRTRNSRWEETESSSAQDQEDEEDIQGQQPTQQIQQQDPEEEDHEDEPMEDDDAMNSKNEEENGEAGGRRTEDGGRKSRRQSRRLPPNDFDLEARIEALPSLNLDDFTRRKKEKKRTSSASSSSHAASHANVHSTSHPAPHTTQATLGVVSSSSRVAAQADSTSDPPPSASATSTATTTVTSWPTAGGVTSTSTSNGGTVGNTSDGEAVSPTPSSSSSTSSVTQQHSPSQGTLLVAGGSLSPGESGSSEGGPRIGSQKRKARKQTITRHDPVNGPLRRDTSVVEPSVLSSMAGLNALAEVALSQPSMKL